MITPSEMNRHRLNDMFTSYYANKQIWEWKTHLRAEGMALVNLDKLLTETFFLAYFVRKRTNVGRTDSACICTLCVAVYKGAYDGVMSWHCVLSLVLLVSGGRLLEPSLGRGARGRGDVAKAPLAAGRHVCDVIQLVVQ